MQKMKKVIFCAASVLRLTALTRHFSRADADEHTFRGLLSGLTTGANPEAVLNRAAERAAALVEATGVYVERLDPKEDQLIATALHGEGLPPIGTRGPYQDSVAAQAIKLGRPIIIGDVSAQSRSILASIGQHLPAVVLPLISEGEALGALIVIRKKPAFREKDISRLEVIADLAAVSLRHAVSLEELEQRSRELEKALNSRKELLRILAHDLRSPVNTIAIAAAVICNEHPNILTMQKLREIIERSTNRMNRLIQDLLDAAVIERAGGLPINPQPQQAHSLAREVCEISRVQAKAKTVDVECQIEGEAVVYADRERLLQVLANLIDNAIKFTPAGGCVTIRSEVRPDHVVFSVSDSGPGISEAYRQRIFEPYFQAPETAHLGSGLGLAIAKQIVEQHGGNIWCESSEGQGSRFVFTIPANQIAA